jgi:hypothetical protein
MKNCKYCGNLNSKSNKNFCSDKCWRLNKKLPLNCKYCNNDLKRSSVIYCGRSCKGKDQIYTPERNLKVSNSLKSSYKAGKIKINTEAMSEKIKILWADENSIYNSKEYRSKIGWKKGEENVAKREHVRKILSQQKLGNKNPTKREDVKEKLRSGSKKRREKYGYILSPDTRLLLRQRMIEYILSFGKGRIGNIGKQEKIILDEQEKINNCKIIRQHHIKELGYVVDGYCQETNTVFEIYEKYHRNQEEKDLKRQKEIENFLKCNFKIIWDIR